MYRTADGYGITTLLERLILRSEDAVRLGEQAKEEKQRLRSAGKKLKLEIKDLDVVKTTLISIDGYLTQEARDMIEGLLKKGLGVFGFAGSEITVNVIEGKRSRIAFEIDGLDPVKSHGGGIVAVSDFLIRVGLILLAGKDRFLLLDEPFAHVSRAYLPDIADLLKYLTDEFNFQLILITHKQELARAGVEINTAELEER